MDRNNLEVQVWKWATDLGFTLPDGTVPAPDFFASLKASLNRQQLWKSIITSVKGRGEVEHIKKQVFVSKLKLGKKSLNPDDDMLYALHYASNEKLSYWYKQKMLANKIQDVKSEIGQIEADITLKARSIQFDVCKMAGQEKQCRDYKEKDLSLSMLTEIEETKLKAMQKLVEDLKMCGNYSDSGVSIEVSDDIKEEIEELEHELAAGLQCTCYEENGGGVCPVTERLEAGCRGRGVGEAELWEGVVKAMGEGVEGLKMSTETDKPHTNSDIPLNCSPVAKQVQSLSLDITSSSLLTLQAATDRAVAESKQTHLWDKVSKIVYFNDAEITMDDVSFLDPSQQSESSVSGRTRKITALKKHFKLLGLKERESFLRREVGRLKEEGKRKEHWGNERKEATERLQTVKAKLFQVIDGTRILKSRHHQELSRVRESHSKLHRSLLDHNSAVSRDKHVQRLLQGVEGVQKYTASVPRLLVDLNLNGLRRLTSFDGLRMYGGEAGEFFSVTLVSPFQSRDETLAVLTERREFSKLVQRLILEQDGGEERRRLSPSKVSAYEESLVKSAHTNEETLRTFSKLLQRSRKMSEAFAFAEKLLFYWMQQPYREMIPNSITHNGLTYKELEEEFKTASRDLKYYSKAKH